jgi:subtilisin family serine protease
MVKILLKLFIFSLLINIATHTMANTSENLKIFDSNIVELNDSIDTYIVYFGNDLNDKEFNKTSFSNQKIKSQKSKQVNRQKRISSRRANTLKEIAAEDYQLIHNYKAVPAMVIRTSGKVIRQLAKSPFVKKIGLDNSGGSGHLNDAIPQTNIDLVKALPLSGAGVEIAIIDSGLDQGHPDFANRVASQVCFSSDCSLSIYDQNGHGTNVTGIVAGAGSIAPEGGSPQVTLHILKVLDANNNFDTSSQIVSALDHIITDLPNVTIVNMSLGTDQLFTSACDDYSSWTRSLADAVNQLNDRGVSLFASAGNEGDNTAITAPACLTNVIAVGATWDNRISNYTDLCTELSPVAGEITCFSNSSGNVDIFAPGALITSTGRNHGISNFAGTSMASPLVASCAVLLRQSQPTITPLELRNALVENGGTSVTDTAGRSFPSLDCWQAYSSLSLDEPPVLTRLSPLSPLISTETTLNFSLLAEDIEDGDISAHATWWVNNISTAVIDGSLNHTFSIGEHTVTAKVIDSANNEVMLSWEVSVIAEDQPPVLTRLSPASPIISTDTTLDFSLLAEDNEDGDISAQITWRVNNVSTAVTGGSLNYTFALGEHTVTAKVIDSANNEVILSWEVTVNQPPVVTPPSSDSSSSGGAINISLIILLFIRFLHYQVFVRHQCKNTNH